MEEALDTRAVEGSVPIYILIEEEINVPLFETYVQLELELYKVPEDFEAFLEPLL